MSNSGIDEFKHINDGDLVEILNRLGKMGQVLGLHAENDVITTHLVVKKSRLPVASTGRPFWNPVLRSPKKKPVHRALFIAARTVPGTSLHFLHTTLSSRSEAVHQAKRMGLKVTVETCPHYLTLMEKDFLALGPVAKCAPPIRSEQEVEALWNSVKNGLRGHDWVGSLALYP